MSADSDRPYPSYINTEQHSLLRTFIAGKLEAMKEYKEAGKYWMGVNADVQTLIEENPAEAFKFAVSTLEPGPSEVDPEAHFREWWQGTALIVLAHPKVEEYLVNELKSETSKLIPQLANFLDYKPHAESIMKKDDLSKYPEAFNFVMAMVLINGLKDKNLASIHN